MHPLNGRRHCSLASPARVLKGVSAISYSCCRIDRGFAQGFERGAEFGREEFGLFPGSKVTTLVHLVPVNQLVKILLGPAAGCAVISPGKRSRDGHLGDVDGGEGASPELCRVPVGP
jgi:hypothetical protein